MDDRFFRDLDALRARYAAGGAIDDITLDLDNPSPAPVPTWTPAPTGKALPFPSTPAQGYVDDAAIMAGSNPHFYDGMRTSTNVEDRRPPGPQEFHPYYWTWKAEQKAARDRMEAEDAVRRANGEIQDSAPLPERAPLPPRRKHFDEGGGTDNEGGGPNFGGGWGSIVGGWSPGLESSAASVIAGYAGDGGSNWQNSGLYAGTGGGSGDGNGSGGGYTSSQFSGGPSPSAGGNDDNTGESDRGGAGEESTGEVSAPVSAPDPTGAGEESNPDGYQAPDRSVPDQVSAIMGATRGKPGESQEAQEEADGFAAPSEPTVKFTPRSEAALTNGFTNDPTVSGTYAREQSVAANYGRAGASPSGQAGATSSVMAESYGRANSLGYKAAGGYGAVGLVQDRGTRVPDMMNAIGVSPGLAEDAAEAARQYHATHTTEENRAFDANAAFGRPTGVPEVDVLQKELAGTQQQQVNYSMQEMQRPGYEPSLEAVTSPTMTPSQVANTLGRNYEGTDRLMGRGAAANQVASNISNAPGVGPGSDFSGSGGMTAVGAGGAPDDGGDSYSPTRSVRDYGSTSESYGSSPVSASPGPDFSGSFEYQGPSYASAPTYQGTTSPDVSVRDYGSTAESYGPAIAAAMGATRAPDRDPSTPDQDTSLTPGFAAPVAPMGARAPSIVSPDDTRGIGVRYGTPVGGYPMTPQDTSLPPDYGFTGLRPANLVNPPRSMANMETPMADVGRPWSNAPAPAPTAVGAGAPAPREAPSYAGPPSSVRDYGSTAESYGMPRSTLADVLGPPRQVQTSSIDPNGGTPPRSIGPTDFSGISTRNPTGEAPMGFGVGITSGSGDPGAPAYAGPSRSVRDYGSTPDSYGTSGPTMPAWADNIPLPRERPTDTADAGPAAPAAPTRTASASPRSGLPNVAPMPPERPAQPFNPNDLATAYQAASIDPGALALALAGRASNNVSVDEASRQQAYLDWLRRNGTYARSP